MTFKEYLLNSKPRILRTNYRDKAIDAIIGALVFIGCGIAFTIVCSLWFITMIAGGILLWIYSSYCEEEAYKHTGLPRD